MNDDFDRWLAAELHRGLSALTREPAPPGRPHPWSAITRRPAMLRALIAAAGAKALVGGTVAALAAGALAGVAVTRRSAPPAIAPSPAVVTVAGGSAAPTVRHGAPSRASLASPMPRASVVAAATPGLDRGQDPQPTATTGTSISSTPAASPSGDQGAGTKSHGAPTPGPDPGSAPGQGAGQVVHGKSGAAHPTPPPAAHGQK